MAKPLSVHEASGKGDRDVAIAAAIRPGDYAMQQLVDDCRVHQSTVSRAEKRGKEPGRSDGRLVCKTRPR
jgi:hypothetical protein